MVDGGCRGSRYRHRCAHEDVAHEDVAPVLRDDVDRRIGLKR
jgi:hypothetical protein